MAGGGGSLVWFFFPFRLIVLKINLIMDMPGKGFVGSDFNLLEVFTVLFFKTASLIFFLFFACPSICTFPIFFFCCQFFGFKQPLLSQADYEIPIERIGTQQTLSLL